MGGTELAIVEKDKQDGKTPDINLCNLPEHIIEQILSYFPKAALYRTILVSKFWERLISKDAVWTRTSGGISRITQVKEGEVLRKEKLDKGKEIKKEIRNKSVGGIVFYTLFYVLMATLVVGGVYLISEWRTESNILNSLLSLSIFGVVYFGGRIFVNKCIKKKFEKFYYWVMVCVFLFGLAVGVSFSRERYKTIENRLDVPKFTLEEIPLSNVYEYNAIEILGNITVRSDFVFTESGPVDSGWSVFHVAPIVEADKWGENDTVSAWAACSCTFSSKPEEEDPLEACPCSEVWSYKWSLVLPVTSVTKDVAALIRRLFESVTLDTGPRYIFRWENPERYYQLWNKQGLDGTKQSWITFALTWCCFSTVVVFFCLLLQSRLCSGPFSINCLAPVDMLADLEMPNEEPRQAVIIM